MQQVNIYCLSKYSAYPSTLMPVEFFKKNNAKVMRIKMLTGLLQLGRFRDIAHKFNCIAIFFTQLKSVFPEVKCNNIPWLFYATRKMSVCLPAQSDFQMVIPCSKVLWWITGNLCGLESPQLRAHQWQYDFTCISCKICKSYIYILESPSTMKWPLYLYPLTVQLDH